MSKKSKLIFLSTALIAIIIALLGTSYAFFTSEVTGDSSETVITSGELSLKLEDGELIGFNNNIIPGDYVEKMFTVVNTGTVEATYDVYLSELENLFVDKTDLVYKLECVSGDCVDKNVGETQMPDVSSKIVNSKSIMPGDENKHVYKLTIKFLNKDESQDDNQGASFSAKISINKVKNPETLVSGVVKDANGVPVPNQAMVAYSDPVYFQTDANGHYEVILEKGKHNIYFIVGKSIEELKEMKENVKTADDVKTAELNTYMDEDVSVNNYIIKYNINMHSGENVSTELIEHGKALNTIEKPVREGYTFDGWYSDSSLKTVYDDSIPIYNDLDVYIKWKANTYTVYFNGNSGTPSVDSMQVTYDQPYGSLPSASRISSNTNDYSLKGWFTQESSGEQVTSSTIVKITSDQTLYANWNESIRNYTTTISLAGSGLSKSSSSVSTTYGGSTTVTITPSTYYYISSVSCTNGYTTNYTVSPSKTGAQTITIYNNSNSSNSTCTFTGARYYIATISVGTGVSTSVSQINIPLNSSGVTTITPSSMYYLNSVSCTNGYTTNASTGINAISSQTVTITNNGSANNTTCTFTGNRYFNATIKVAGTGLTSSVTKLKIPKNGSNTFRLTTSSSYKEYYLKSATCTNSYKVTATTGTTATSNQTITITNPNNTLSPTCTFTGARILCHNTGSNGWSADVNCSGTIQKCYYNGTLCDGGTKGTSYRFYGCTGATTTSRNPYTYCKKTITSVAKKGGKVPTTCSC